VFYVLNPVSGNTKTGPMPVSTSNSTTCPDACPIKAKGCYAKYGPVGMHWRKLDNGESKNAVEWPQFIRQVKALSNNTLWRHNQAGQDANVKGFTINVSGNDVNHADKLKALNVAPVVVIMPRDAEKVSYTPAGNKVVICPAENNDKVNCVKCALCQDVKRDYIIGFRAHGTAAKSVELIARG
jgi:hypothetical protein